ncbi:ABC transporter permease [Actinomadura flavalba]|uniref:ABC transporter permease n=1 Tax=Actinomadura flavalba TaxID=1120938 RepID=UPI000369CCFC|nr:ABC transporter permease [Actinomadura flavalba]
MSGGLPGALASEWTKAWSVRSTWWGLLGGAVLMVAASAQMSIYVTNANTNDDPSDDKGVVGAGMTAVQAMDLAQFAVIGLVMLLVTAEYASGAIRSTLTWVPVRGTVVLAKTGAAAALGLVAGTALALLGSLAAAPMLGDWADLSAASWTRDVLAAGVYAALIGVVALGAGFALRSTALTLTTVFLLLFVIPATLQSVGSDTASAVADYFPGVAGAAFMRGGDDAAYPPPAGLGVLALWAVAAVLAGYAVFRRRDA